MNASKVILWIVGAAFALVDGTYVVWNLISDQFEIVGTLALGLSATMCILFAFYFGLLQRGAPAGALPEDRLDATIDDGDAELGHFSPWSWWPVALAGGAALAFLGLAVGPWIIALAVPLVVVAIIGWTYESYRGSYAR